MDTTKQQPRVRDYDDLRAAMREGGSHFLDADAMRFFASRLGYGPIQTADRRAAFFVTSERFEGSGGSQGPRLYSVRVWCGGTQTTDIGGFQAYTYSGKAKAALRDALERYKVDAPADVLAWADSFPKIRRDSLTGELRA